MSHWNHRVVKREYESLPGTFETIYSIHEAHYNEGETKPWAITSEPTAASAESVEELREVLGMMLRALDKPVLDYEEIGRGDTGEGVQD